MQKFLNHKSFYIKKWSLDILVDILGGILIALGTYNFAALAQFPMAGLNGIALIFYHLFGFPIGRTALLLNIPIPDDLYYFCDHGLPGSYIPCL